VKATKKVGSTHFQRRPRLPGIEPAAVEEIVSKGATSGRLAAARFLGEVVPNVRELIRQLVPEKDHRDDDRDRDNGDDECVFH
jgi:hypothetical protein